MTATIPDSDRDSPSGAAVAVFISLIVCAAGVAVVTFTLSFVGLSDYGQRLMGLPETLSPLVPAGVDTFSLCGIAATYLLRHAPWRVRAYAWTVFLVPSGLSIAGNLAHAQAKNLPASGMVGAAVAPVLLALSAHLVIVAGRWAFGDSDRKRNVDSDSVSRALASSQVSTGESLSRDGEPRQPERRPANATPDDVRLGAINALIAGGDIDEIAAQTGVTVRTVQRWADDATKAVEAAKTRSRRSRSAAGRRQRASGAGDSTPTSGGPVGTDPANAVADEPSGDEPRQPEPTPIPDDAWVWIAERLHAELAPTGPEVGRRYRVDAATGRRWIRTVRNGDTGQTAPTGQPEVADDTETTDEDELVDDDVDQVLVDTTTNA